MGKDSPLHAIAGHKKKRKKKEKRGKNLGERTTFRERDSTQHRKEKSLISYTEKGEKRALSSQLGNFQGKKSRQGERKRNTEPQPSCALIA